LKASEEETMVGVTVTFQFGDDFDREKIEGVAREAAPMFQGLPGLRFKVFTLDEESRRAVNFYLWESHQPATEFFTPELAEKAKEFYGIAPTSIEFLEVAGIVDNSRLPEAVA
jgi:hypothetical protein